MLPMRSMEFFKRLALMLLVVLVDMVYKTDVAHGYKLLSTSSAGNEGCSTYCKSNGYASGVIGWHGYSTVGYFTSFGDGYSTSCVCLTSTEWSLMLSCYQQSCGSNMASGTHKSYNFAASSCQVAHKCACASGAFKVSSNSCSTCKSGYYCPKDTYFSTETSSGLVGCAAGYYCSTTGLVSQTKCPVKYYTSTMYNTTCTVCNSGYYCPGGTRVQCTYGYYCPGTANSVAIACSKGYYCPSNGLAAGVKCPDNPPATTTGTGSKYATQCYYPANTDASDDYGTYQFTSACYYAS